MEPNLCDLVLVEISGHVAPAIVTGVHAANEDGSHTIDVSTFHTRDFDARNCYDVALYTDRDAAVEGAGVTGTPTLVYAR